MDLINNFFANLSNFLWGNFGVANLVIGGGIFFLLYSRLTPFRYFKHAFDILLGKYDDPSDDGQISHNTFAKSWNMHSNLLKFCQNCGMKRTFEVLLLVLSLQSNTLTV